VPYARRRRPGLLGTVARTAVISGTATATANAVNRRAHDRSVAQQQPVAPVQPAGPAPPQPAPTDLVGQLRGLGRLGDTGILTAAEFDAAKAALLSR
jgi:hypothetical protein